MQLRSPLGPHAGLSLMLALVACGCAALPPAMTGSSPAKPGQAANPAVPMGRVVVDLTQVANALSKRHLTAVGFSSSAGIDKLRVRAYGPGMSETVSASQPYTGLVGAISFEVPQGPNRVFRLEGLSSDGGVLASLSTCANVNSQSSIPLTFDIGTTAAAYTLKRLLDPLEAGETDSSNIRSTLATTDITADLKAFVQAACNFDSTTNSVGLVDPRYFRVQALVKVLYTDGLSAIQAKKVGESPAAIQVPATLNNGTKGILALAIRTSDGLPVINAPISGEVFDLNPSGVKATGTDESGTLTFSDVGIGVFDVKLTLADGSVAWVHDVGVRDNGISYATYTLPSTAVAPPTTIVNSYSKLPAIAENTRSHEKLLAWVQQSECDSVNIMALDDKGQPLNNSWNMACAGPVSSIESTFLPGATAADDRYIVCWSDSGNVNLASVATNGSADPTVAQTTAGGTFATAPAALAVSSSGIVAPVWVSNCGVTLLRVGNNGLNLGCGGWFGGTPYFGPSGIGNVSVAAGGSGELLVTWTSGSDVVAERITRDPGGLWLDQPTFTVASGVAGSLGKTVAAYDSNRNEYLVGWEWNDGTKNHISLKQLLPGAGNALSAGSANFDINNASTLSGSRLSYVAGRSEFMLGYYNGADNSLRLQKLVPSSAGNPPAPATLVVESAQVDKRLQDRTLMNAVAPSYQYYPSPVSFTYDSKAALYRAAWIRSSSLDSAGALIFGSYRP